MLRFVLASLLLLSTTALARADEIGTHDAGWDPGAKVALGGAIAFSFVYSTTAIAGGVGDSLCGLGESAGSCDHPHGNLAIPLVGGFLPGRDDWSRNVGIASSVIQLTAAGILVGGLVAHHWRIKNDRRAAR
jgi:hypothetical protein